MLDARPDVLNHNIETVPRLYRTARPGGRYDRALQLLDRSRAYAPAIPTKSGLMVGLGEEWDEVVATLRDLRAVGCQIVTIGQYLRPSLANLPMVALLRARRVRRAEAPGARDGLRPLRIRPARPQLLPRARADAGLRISRALNGRGASPIASFRPRFDQATNRRLQRVPAFALVLPARRHREEGRASNRDLLGTAGSRLRRPSGARSRHRPGASRARRESHRPGLHRRRRRSARVIF